MYFTDIPAVGGGEFQEMSSKCNIFLDPNGFSSEDITSPFNIPRTSSIAKSKRPSVSFAEGTRFSPMERRGSAQDAGALARGKPKSGWGIAMLSVLQNQGSATTAGQEDEGEATEMENNVDATEVQETSCETGDQDPDQTPSRTTVQVAGAAGRRRTMSNTAAQKGNVLTTPGADAQVNMSKKVTTVYVTVGKAGRPVTQTNSEGPVQAMLRRLGSLQRQKEQESCRNKTRGGEVVTKPPRRKLGARASVWEQGGTQGGQPAGETAVCKPLRRKHESHVSSDTVNSNESPVPESGAPKRPLSSILTSVPELTSADSGSVLIAQESTGGTESNYLTVGPTGENADIIANAGAVVSGTDEPCYENVMIHQS